MNDINQQDLSLIKSHLLNANEKMSENFSQVVPILLAFLDVIKESSEDHRSGTVSFQSHNLRRAFAALLRSIPYDEYLKSKHWQSVKTSALCRFSERCAICNSKESLNVHHRTYANLGNESEDDTTVLCQPCHELFHKHRRLSK